MQLSFDRMAIIRIDLNLSFYFTVSGMPEMKRDIKDSYCIDLYELKPFSKIGNENLRQSLDQSEYQICI